MRDEFHEITSGWTLISGMDDITDRIERAAEWTEANGPLEPDEQATVEFMIQTQIARGIARGDFDDCFDPDDNSGCYECGGRGWVVRCIDDLCHGQDECIHGDPPDPCMTCNPKGEREDSYY